MVEINFITKGGTRYSVDGGVGMTIMETAVSAGVPGIVAECGGSCSCATCHVYVDEAWLEKVGHAGDDEAFALDSAFDVRANSRLSCQIRITEELNGLVVTTPARQG